MGLKFKQETEHMENFQPPTLPVIGNSPIVRLIMYNRQHDFFNNIFFKFTACTDSINLTIGPIYMRAQIYL